ncbi:MAG: hypothetical protein BGP06_16720 [Rhizobiales bacterium 65-9]|nr:DUF2076 domain-containing protein [Hyphomicrobiales bacterium]OJY38091.1 MAG: hypothetical protein BGP06_16720 [Rhizobiales bacterium 65-9]
MTPEERNVIGGIFDRLREAAQQPRDPEAERFIADRVREQPYAPYAMAQSIYVQEQAIGNLTRQVEELQAQVEQLSRPAPQSGGFLSGIFGGGAPARQGPMPGFAPRAQQPAPPPQGSPWGQPQQASGPWGQPQPGGAPAQQQRGGMGFLGTALTTAAGVAGGMVVGNALMSAFNSHGGASGIADSLGMGGDKSAGASSAGDQSANYDSAGYQDPGQTDASYDNASYEDEGGYDDGADSGDWT